MGISAAEAERVHADQTFAVRLGKWFYRGRHTELQFFEIDVRVGRFEMQARGNLAVLKNEHGLEQTRHAGRGFEMANVCLYRTNG